MHSGEMLAIGERPSIGDETAPGRGFEVNVAPERWSSSGASLATVCPETALMYAVLEDACLCFQGRSEKRRYALRAREAEEWFFSDDARGSFSFLAICIALGVEPEPIRQRLRHWKQFSVEAPMRETQGS
jgi:hypothetical protein